MKLKDSKMNQRLLACFIWITLCCGCTQSEVVIDNKPGKSEEVSACLRLNILSSTITHTRSMSFTTKGTTETDSISVTPGNDATKSTTDPGEAADKEILNLWVGQYNATGELVVEEYFSSLPTQESVNLPLKRIEGTSHVWVVANAGNLQGNASTENDLKALTKSDAFTDDGLPLNNLCMMTGMWSGTITDNIEAQIQLKRSVAKIKFTYSVGGTNFSFTPATLELCNVPVSMKYIGDETPVQLNGDENFKTYTVASPGSSGTHYWYIPENPAGTGSNTGDIATNKIGEGVTHATCIRLTGEAVQDGVTYGDVVFTLYPGKGNNDYNIVRNGLYTIDVALTGIDFSDKRVTVGTVPDMQAPENLGAEKGATGVFQVTTRPGMPWSFTVPNWLSAVVGNQTYDSGTRLDFIGPYKVNFQTTTANPRAEIRETSFLVEGKTITVRQNPSSLTVGSSSIELEAGGGSTGSGTFIATKGLPWAAALSSDGVNWLAWNGDAPVSGAEATGENETLAVKAASSNPSSSNRTGTILLKGGDAISDAGYHDLTGNISVVQKGSIASGSSMNITPEAAENLSGTFKATSGLSWNATVTAEDSWLSLLEDKGTTTGSNQSISYSAALNLSSTERIGTITLQVGNNRADDHPGPTADITVKQGGSVFSATAPPELPAAGGSVTGTITATEGLPWVIKPEISNGITVEPTSGKGDSQLTFTAPKNTLNSRSGNFKISVDKENFERIIEISVLQPGGINSIVIDQTTATAYKELLDITLYPPFKKDGSDYKGKSSDCTISVPYSIEVEKTQSSSYVYSSASSYCVSKGNGWRIPTMIELFAMWQICRGTNDNAMDEEDASISLGEKFIDTWYWSCAIYPKDSGRRCLFMFNGTPYHGATSYPWRVRCVKDI